MPTDIKNAIKARLLDMKYTPFLASYIILWFFFNAKLFLIFFSGMQVDEKVTALSYDNILYILPFLYALGYTIFFPALSIILYAVTLAYKIPMKWVQGIMLPFFQTSKTTFLIPTSYDTDCNSFPPLKSKLLI
jgi:hypothetical protein